MLHEKHVQKLLQSSYFNKCFIKVSTTCEIKIFKLLILNVNLQFIQIKLVDEKYLL